MPDDTDMTGTVISSVIVQAHESALDAIISDIARMPGAEIDSRVLGKLIVILESSSDGHLADTVSEISAIPGVLGVNLVFHHTEPAQEAGEQAGELP